MNSDSTCRCCLSLFEQKPIEITEEVFQKFFEVTQIELKVPSDCLSPSICSSCNIKLSEFCDFRSELRRLHNEDLYENMIIVKVEPDEIDDFDSTEPLLAIKDEFNSDSNVDSREEEKIVIKSRGRPKKTKNDKISWFECELCDKKYKWNHSLQTHKQKAHDEKSQEPEPQKFLTSLCQICAKIVGGGRTGLDNHMLTAHSETYNYFCDLCPKKSKTRKSLVKHMKTHIAPEFRKKFLCSICSGLFTTKPSLERHTLIVHSNAPGDYKCDCGLAFKTKEHLKFHYSRKHDLGTFQCIECSKIFATKLRLDTHMKEFHVEKEPCNICGRLVRGRKMMVRHLKTHEGRKFKCTYENCSKDFFSNEALNDHISEKHKRIKNFVCPTCGSSFATAKNLRKHVARQHRAKKVPCAVPGCSHSAARKNYLAAHYRAHKDIDEETKSSFISALDSIKWYVW